jgi:hypothetical protein
MWYLYRYSYVYDKDGQFTYRIFKDTVITGKTLLWDYAQSLGLADSKASDITHKTIKQEVEAVDEAGATIQVSL